MESWVEANKRMSCLDCGASGAAPYVTTKGENPRRNVRVCSRCLDRWIEFGLRSRDAMYEEPSPDSDRLLRCPDGCGNDCCVPTRDPFAEEDEDWEA